jgi:hypothetical protein
VCILCPENKRITYNLVYISTHIQQQQPGDVAVSSEDEDSTNHLVPMRMVINPIFCRAPHYNKSLVAQHTAIGTGQAEGHRITALKKTAEGEADHIRSSLRHG